LLPLLANGVPFMGDDSNSTSVPGPNLDDRQTRAALSDTGVESPPIGPETVEVYLARLAADGLLAKPETKARSAVKSTSNGQARRRGSRKQTHGSK
jgi:hypothetical protein